MSTKKDSNEDSQLLTKMFRLDPDGGCPCQAPKASRCHGVKRSVCAIKHSSAHWNVAEVPWSRQQLSQHSGSMANSQEPQTAEACFAFSLQPRKSTRTNNRTMSLPFATFTSDIFRLPISKKEPTSSRKESSNFSSTCNQPVSLKIG